MANARPQSIGSLDGTPAWRRVPPHELTTAPWSGLCFVQVSDQFGPRETGTGWLAGRRTVITAAHVVAPARSTPGFSVRVTFPFNAVSAAASESAVHEQYGKSPGPHYDAFDIAALRVDVPGVAPLKRDRLGDTDGPVEVAGFPDLEAGALVTQVAPMKRLDDVILLHKVDTWTGHSGAPVVGRGGASSEIVVATHVGNFNSNPYSSLGRWNVALLIRGALDDFIEAHVAAWGGEGP